MIPRGLASAPSLPPLVQQGQLTSAGRPGSGPCLALSLSLQAVLAHSSCFPFTSWLRSLQRAWEHFPSEAAVSVPHSGQFSCHPAPSSCSNAHLRCCWMCPRQSELRARDGAGRNSCHGLLGAHPPAHWVQGTGNPPCPASHLQPEGKHHISRFLHRSSSALFLFPQMRAPRKASRAANQLTGVKA